MRIFIVLFVTHIFNYDVLVVDWVGCHANEERISVHYVHLFDESRIVWKEATRWFEFVVVCSNEVVLLQVEIQILLLLEVFCS